MGKKNKLMLWFMIWWYKLINGYTKVSVKALYSQAWHETGNFKSEVFKENKNLFGMRHPRKRQTTSIGSNKAHAVYKNHKDSIIDYFNRQKYFKIPNDDDRVYMENTVNSGYAEDRKYISKWQNVIDTIRAPVNNFFIYIGLFFFVLAIVALILILKSKNKKK